MVSHSLWTVVPQRTWRSQAEANGSDPYINQVETKHSAKKKMSAAHAVDRETLEDVSEVHLATALLTQVCSVSTGGLLPIGRLDHC